MRRNNLSVAFSLNAKLTFKVIAVGKKNIGKTSLIIRSIKGLFEPSYKVTVGVEFYSKLIQDEEEEIALQIWDTSGNQNHQSIIRSFYNLANCVMLLYERPEDLLQDLHQWLHQIQQYVNESTRLVLVRTKTDLLPITAEEQDSAQELVQTYGMEFFIGVSARTNHNVQELFTKIALRMKSLYTQNEQFKKLIDHKSDSLILKSVTRGKKNKERKCCGF